MASMAANFTLGKKGYETVRQEAESLLAVSENCRQTFTRLAVEDMDAYGRFSEAYSLPGKTPEQKEARKKKISEAAQGAAEIPLMVMETNLRLMRILRKLADIGNRNLISDVGVAAYLADASLKSAKLNVEINLGCIDDESYAERTRRRMEDCLSEASGSFLDVTEKVGALLAEQ